MNQRVFLWSMLAAASAALAAGCEKPLAPPSAPPPESTAGVASSAATDRLSSKDLSLYLYDKKTSSEGTTKPRFMLQAESSSLSDQEMWSVEKAKATVYSTRGEDIQLEAAHGSLDQRKDKETATLTGGATLRTGTTVITLDSVQWMNLDGIIKSDAPVSMVSEGFTMQASSLTYNPDQDDLVTTDVSGTMDLKGVQQP